MNELRIKDLYLLALLLNEGHEPLRMERDGKVCWFVFQDNGKIDQLIDLYWQDKVVTKVKSYADKIRHLKDRIFAENR